MLRCFSVLGELHALSDQTYPEAPNDAWRDAARAWQSWQGAAQHVLAGHIQDRNGIFEEFYRGAGDEAKDQTCQERAVASTARRYAKNGARFVFAVLQKSVAQRQEHGLLDISALHEGAISTGEVRQTRVCREKSECAELLYDRA